MTRAHSEPTLEQQIRLLEQRLTQAQKMTALGELVSTTTHEFNNVLTTIINYAKLGLRHQDDASRNKAFDKILVAAQRAAKLTNSILGYARNRSLGLEPTDLKKIVEDTVSLLERELHKHRVQCELALTEAPYVQACGNQVQQVLMNLVINARQAMPQGGRLTIGLRHEPNTPWVDLTVRDTGSGMTPEVMRRIFDRFFTTKSGPDDTGKGGTGLGLAACRDIIEAHQGKIRVESAVGRGTLFTIRLPVALKAEAASIPTLHLPTPATINVMP